MRLLIVRLWLLALSLGSVLPTATRVQADEPQSQSPAAAEASPTAHGESPAARDAEMVRAKQLAKHVTIYRDAWGGPHVDGDTDESLLFGFAFAQAEDYFWQLEDSYVLSLGRYSEVHGPTGVNSDLLNHTFEVVPIAQAGYARADSKTKGLCEAFALGLNYYLGTHPDVQPRLIRHFEPWHVMAFGRQITLELCYRYTRLSQGFMPRSHRLIWAQVGSNGWAIGPSKTRSGHAMLFANPHQPWFGFGQMYEAHLRSGEGWNFTGATLFGNPMLSLGHNEHLGWTLTTNEPDIADVWRLTFDDPENALHYRGPNGEFLTATQWDDTIHVKTADGMNHRDFKLRKTKFGPIVARDDDQHYLAARIAGFQDTQMLRQSLEMMRAQNLDQFKHALALQQFPIMNVIYADGAGNILYVYNGLIPRRDPKIDWSKPVDATQPNADWQGIHTLDELPQVLNPPSGYLQNCNSSPFTVCDRGNCDPKKYPPYMAEDADDDKRRAKMSRELLEGADSITFERLQELAFDTTIYWAKHALPEYARRWEKLNQRDPTLAGQVEPYLKHLLKWDCRVKPDSTQATLCEAWYTELYGMSYPGDQLQARFVENPDREFQALVQAAVKLTSIFGSWRVAWGDAFRMQRRANIVDLLSMPFDDQVASLPCLGVPGPMGAIFTQYYAPSVRLRFIRPMKKRYGLLGTSYVGVYEFDQRVRGASLVNFGESGDPKSPHYFDQAKLLSDRKLKPELFYWDDVVAAAKQAYHPGEKSEASMAAQ